MFSVDLGVELNVKKKRMKCHVVGYYSSTSFVRMSRMLHKMWEREVERYIESLRFRTFSILQLCQITFVSKELVSISCIAALLGKKIKRSV